MTMTEQKSLVKLTVLIEEVAEAKTIRRGGEWVGVVNSEEIATHLITHGVTVKQIQKPMTLEELDEAIGNVLWFENGTFLGAEPLKLMCVTWFDAEFEQFGSKEWQSNKLDDYGYTWRCWASEPTSEEMEDAEWLK